MALEPGTRLGPYEIMSLRGKGGMGEVYRGRDLRLGREVAIKVLPRELAEGPLLRQRLRREAMTISQLRHSHICTLYDVGAEEGVDGRDRRRHRSPSTLADDTDHGRRAECPARRDRSQRRPLE